jgi:hypothetical protein
MRQRGSERIRPRSVSHGSGHSNDPSVLAPRTDQSVDVGWKRYADTGESITDVPLVDHVDDTIDAIDTIAARDYTRRLNERRTRSERYLLHCLSRGKVFILTMIS